MFKLLHDGLAERVLSGEMPQLSSQPSSSTTSITLDGGEGNGAVRSGSAMSSLVDTAWTTSLTIGSGFLRTLLRLTGLKADNLSDERDAGETSLEVKDSRLGREKFSMDRERRKSEGLYGDIKLSFGGGSGRGGVIGRYCVVSVRGDAGSSASVWVDGRVAQGRFSIESLPT